MSESKGKGKDKTSKHSENEAEDVSGDSAAGPSDGMRSLGELSEQHLTKC